MVVGVCDCLGGRLLREGTVLRPDLTWSPAPAAFLDLSIAPVSTATQVASPAWGVVPCGPRRRCSRGAAGSSGPVLGRAARCGREGPRLRSVPRSTLASETTGL